MKTFEHHEHLAVLQNMNGHIDAHTHTHTHINKYFLYVITTTTFQFLET